MIRAPDSDTRNPIRNPLCPSGGPIPIEIRQLTWGYLPYSPLGQDVSLNLEPGQSVAIVGPNGAGKTALLQTVAGLIPPLAGDVLLQGTSLTELSPMERARRLAVLPQDMAEHGDLTVQELVELGRTPYLGLWGNLGAEDYAAVTRALAICQLSALTHRPLQQISGGERQRARIALAVAQNTPLLLLDEPANHLDLRRRHEFFALLTQLRQEHHTAILMVLHDLADAYREADRVLVIHHGQAEEISAEDSALTRRLAQAFEVPETVISL